MAGPKNPSATPDVVARHSPPAWVASLVLHVALIVLLGLTLRFTPRGASSEDERHMAGEVVLKHHTEQGDYYETQESASEAAESNATSPQDVLQEAVDSGPSLDLPAADFGPLAGQDPSGGVSGGLTGNPSQPRTGLGGEAETSVFGVSGQGHSFVYVFDRSASMGSPNNLPLAAAKTAMKSSLAHLNDGHSFHIIFYNETPQIFTPPSVKNRLIFANDRNKTLAHRFIDGVIADGSTRHREALLRAVALGPDVIYFLTDADRQHDLSPQQVEEILSRNRAGATINTIQFGFHAYVAEENFMVKLARRTGGAYKYVNVRELVSGQ